MLFQLSQKLPSIVYQAIRIILCIFPRKNVFGFKLLNLLPLNGIEISTLKFVAQPGKRYHKPETTLLIICILHGYIFQQTFLYNKIISIFFHNEGLLNFGFMSGSVASSENLIIRYDYLF